MGYLPVICTIWLFGINVSISRFLSFYSCNLRQCTNLCTRDSCTYSINEYEGRTVPCSDDVTIGISTSTGDGDAQCPLPGEEVLSSFGIHGINQNFWFNVIMMIVLQVVFRFGAYAVLRRSK